MGAIANGIMAYAQPLIDQTDGSLEQMNRALTITQICYNLAVVPEDKRDQLLRELQPSLGMEESDFEEFRNSIILPMIRRHEEMFPRMHGRKSAGSFFDDPAPRAQPKTALTVERDGPIDRYAPCPCNSGKKYKFCCGVKPR